MQTHLYVPDTQIKPDAPTNHLEWLGELITEIKPTALIFSGDQADMESLSEYDRGKRSFEGRRYIKDVDAVRKGMELILAPADRRQSHLEQGHRKRWKMQRVLTLGNHEERILRAINNDARLDGTLGLNDLGYEDFDIKVIPFLEPITIDGVTYAHYFYQPKTGRPISGTADSRLNRIGFSFTQGHEQGKLIGSRELNNGEIQRAVIAGSFYLHDETYKGPQANGHWRGVLVKTNVEGGNYDLAEISMDALCRKYEGISLKRFMQRYYPDLYNNSPWLRRV